MSDSITLSRAALQAAIAAYLLQESHNSWIAGQEGSRPIDESEAAAAAARLVEVQAARMVEPIGGFKPGYRHHIRQSGVAHDTREYVGTCGGSIDAADWEIVATRWVATAADLAAWEQEVVL